MLQDAWFRFDSDNDQKANEELNWWTKSLNEIKKQN